MEQEIKEFNEALYALRDKVNNVHVNSLLAREKLGDVINRSNLRSTLSLLKEDIGLRRLLNLNK